MWSLAARVGTGYWKSRALHAQYGARMCAAALVNEKCVAAVMSRSGTLERQLE